MTDPDDIWQMVDQLIAWQDERAFNNKQMAERLGVPRTSWSAYRNRSERPGLRFAHRISTRHGFGQIARPFLNPRKAVKA